LIVVLLLPDFMLLPPSITAEASKIAHKSKTIQFAIEVGKIATNMEHGTEVTKRILINNKSEAKKKKS
jgi:hypothetical protein